MYPSGDIGDTGFDKSFKSNKGVYSFINENFLLEQNVEKYSKKIYELLKLARTSTGLHYIYSLFDKSGALTIALAFQANGYAFYSKEGRYDSSGRFVGGKKLLSNVQKARCAICGNLQQEEHSEHNFRQGTFVLFTGSESAGIQDALQVYNSFENKDGHLIKFVIGSLVSAEGVDYKRIKNLHVINPWYNFTRTWQAIGRGLRNCSQADFPEGERNVVVYLYSSASSTMEIETIDEQMYRLSLEKDIRIKDIERTLKSVSIDCALNKEANKYASDKDYSRECDYKECSFECSFEPSNDSETIINNDTFNIRNTDPEIHKAINLIFLMFKKKGFYSLDEILKQLYNQVGEDYIFIALTRYITKKLILKDKFSRSGTMVYKNGYYFYQPNEIEDVDIPLRYKQTPLLLKTTNITVIAPPKRLKAVTREKSSSSSSSNRIVVPDKPDKLDKLDKPENLTDSKAFDILNNILIQPSVELMSYYFDSYPEDTIIEMTNILLKKSEYFEPEKAILLLRYLRKAEFVLAEQYNETKHNEDVYWKDGEIVYVGHRGGYWKIIDYVNVLLPTGNMVLVTDTLKSRELLRYNEQNTKRVSSIYKEGCNLHGIISYGMQREFKILHNPSDEAIMSKDSRKKPSGKVASSYTVSTLKQFIQCLNSNKKDMKKDELVKEIELELRRKEYSDESNFKWLVRIKK